MPTTRLGRGTRGHVIRCITGDDPQEFERKVEGAIGEMTDSASKTTTWELESVHYSTSPEAGATAFARTCFSALLIFVEGGTEGGDEPE